MNSVFQINPQLDIPIYQQLVDRIRASVKQGLLQPGQQLPTVQDLATELSIARGTIKRAYDDLERDGIVEKVQGRGTFVCYQPVSSLSRKDQAMNAIDSLLDQLEKMGFSPAEVNIFLNLKLRERAEQLSDVKVAVLECNPENLSHVSEQLRQIKHIDLYSYQLDSIKQYPYKLGDDIELIVTTAEHAGYLEAILPVKKRVARVALRLATPCLASILKLRQGKRVGILGYSDRFAQLLHSTCQSYTDGLRLSEPQTFDQISDMDAFLQDLDAVLVPQAYEKYCSRSAYHALRAFGGELIECAYELDEGSFLYLREKTKRMLEEKSI